MIKENNRSKALNLITLERARQIIEEGYSAEHDDKYNNEELARAAACYAIPAPEREIYAGNGLLTHGVVKTIRTVLWPWNERSWKPTTPEDRIIELVKSGALIIAALERELRLKNKESKL